MKSKWPFAILGFSISIGLSLLACSAQPHPPEFKYLDLYTTTPLDVSYGQFQKLTDNRVLYISNNIAWIFDPKTKKRQPAPSWMSANIRVDNDNIHLLNLGKNRFLAIPGSQSSNFTCRNHGTVPSLCPSDKIPLIDLGKNKISWIPFPLLSLKEYSATVLPDNRVVFLGGHYDSLKTEITMKPNGNKTIYKKPVHQNNMDIISFDSETLKYKTIGKLKISRSKPAIILGPKGVFIVGGVRYDNNGIQIINAVEKLKITDGSTSVSASQFSAPFSGGGLFLSPSNYTWLDTNRVFIPMVGIVTGKLSSIILDVEHPEKSIMWGTLNSPEFETTTCVILNDKRAICHSGQAVRLINPFDLSIYMMQTKMTSQLSVMNLPDVGILYMGRMSHENILTQKPEEAIYLLKLEALIKDLKNYGKRQ